ncbi:MAG: PilZ domain-containing protein [Hyphomicrobiaceae bacterium]|nr:PilZ domain-containing protein [Hyphomicrobiaceae bacterium]
MHQHRSHVSSAHAADRADDQRDGDGSETIALNHAAWMTPGAFSELRLATFVHDEHAAHRPSIARLRAFSLLVALRPEISRIGLLVAISSSAANALASGAGESAMRSLIKFYPASSSALMLASSRHRRLLPDSKVSRAIAAFNDAVQEAMNATMSMIAERACGDDRCEPVSVEALAAAWREAANSTRNLLVATDQAIGDFQINGRTSEHDLLLKALASVSTGGTPFMSMSGTFAMPDWAEQRREPRIAVDCTAMLTSDAGTCTIRVTDISTLGAGIEGAGQLAEQARVLLIIDQSVTLPATVMWSTPLRAGIAFNRQLVDDDPAYRFLMQRALEEKSKEKPIL